MAKSTRNPESCKEPFKASFPDTKLSPMTLSDTFREPCNPHVTEPPISAYTTLDPIKRLELYVYNIYIYILIYIYIYIHIYIYIEYII